MPEIIIRIAEQEKKLFTQKVGRGNVSNAIKMYIQRCIYTKPDNLVLAAKVKRLELLQKQKEKIDTEYFQLQAEVETMNELHEKEELSKLEKEAGINKKKQQILQNTLKQNLRRVV